MHTLALPNIDAHVIIACEGEKSDYGKKEFAFTGLVIRQGKSYTSLCPELDVASQGDTIRAAKDALLEAAALYLDGAIENNLPYLRPVPPDEDPRNIAPKQIVQTFPLRVNIAVRAYA